MWWILVLACLLAPFIYLLFAPFFVEIDSKQGVLLRLRFHKVAQASVIFIEDSVYLDLEFAYWLWRRDLLKARENKKEPKAKRKTKDRSIPFRKIVAIIRSFKIKKLKLHMDTGDNQVNGILYPVAILLSHKTRKDISINFCDVNLLQLSIQNNIARIIWAYMKA